MIHEVEEIDDMSGTPLACTRLHELRIKTDSLRGSYGTSQPEVGVAAALTYFEGKSSKEKSKRCRWKIKTHKRRSVLVLFVSGRTRQCDANLNFFQ